MADHDTWPDDPNVAPKRKNSSGCGKAALIVGGLGLLCMLLCCGGGGLFVWSVFPKVVNSPAEVTEMSQQILEMEVPDGFKPETGFSVDNFMMSMRIAVYSLKEDKGGLIVGDFRIKLGDQKQIQDFRNKSAANGGQPKNLQIGKTEVREFDVKGRKLSFRFSEAIDPDSKKDFRVVESEWGAPGGGVFIKMFVEADEYDEEAAIQMIESIR